MSSAERASPDRTPLLGSAYIGLAGAQDEAEIQRRSRNLLARALNTRRVVAFIGAGLSRAYNHPSWEELAHDILNKYVEGAKKTGSAVEMFRSFLEGSEPAGVLRREERILLLLGLCRDQFTLEDRRQGFFDVLTEGVNRSREPVDDDHDPLRCLRRVFTFAGS